jgi:hypothetical protein
VVQRSVRHDIIPRAPGGIVDAHGKDIHRIRAKRRGHVKRKRRVSPFVIAEVSPVQPDIRDVVDRKEVQMGAKRAKRIGNGKCLAVPDSIP